VYDGHREVFNEPTKAQSLVKAKLALRAYKVIKYHDRGLLAPLDRWASLTPVFAETREEELRGLAGIALMRIAAAQRGALQ
jgi:hypothetical protein